jgi:hypothetical protein
MSPGGICPDVFKDRDTFFFRAKKPNTGLLNHEDR